MEAEAAHAVARGSLLLGVGADQRRSDAENLSLGPGAGLPGPLARFCPSGSDRLQQIAVDLLDGPVGGAVRCHRPEQRLLVSQGHRGR